MICLNRWSSHLAIIFSGLSAISPLAYSSGLHHDPCTPLLLVADSKLKDDITTIASIVQAAIGENLSYSIVPILTEADRIDAEVLFNFILQNRSTLAAKGKYKNAVEDQVNSGGVIRDLSLLSQGNELIVRNLVGKINKILRTSFPLVMSDKRISDVQLRWSHDDVKGFVEERWHVDGGGFSAILTLKGQGTEIYRLPALDKIPPYEIGENSYSYGIKYLSEVIPTTSAPVGSLLIFSGSESEHFNAGYLPTFHRSPRISEDRLILVVRYNLHRKPDSQFLSY